MKSHGSTVELPLILGALSTVGVGGIYGVAVKCIDTIRNPDSVGGLLSGN